MTVFGGYMGKVVMINLSTRKISNFTWSDEDRSAYLGGKIMATKIISDNVPKEIKAFDEDNMIVISTGPLTATSPSSSRFEITTLSPVSNGLSSSNCGGLFGFNLKKAGIDALIITGKAAQPIWIEISDGMIRFHEVYHLWGMITSSVIWKLSLEKRDSGILTIGPAGENLVLCANLYSEDRSVGKDGIGAVFGSKNLKIISVTGTKFPKIIYEKDFNHLNAQWIQSLKKNPKGNLYDLYKNVGCKTCPSPCDKMKNYQGMVVKGKEIDILQAIGKQISVIDYDIWMEWKKLCDDLGLDTIHIGDAILESNIESKEAVDEFIINVADRFTEINVKPSKRKKAESHSLLRMFEESISACGICVFTLPNLKSKNSSSFLNDLLIKIELKFSLPHLKALRYVTGMKLSLQEFVNIGKRGMELEEYYNNLRKKVEETYEEIY